MLCLFVVSRYWVYVCMYVWCSNSAVVATVASSSLLTMNPSNKGFFRPFQMPWLYPEATTPEVYSHMYLNLHINTVIDNRKYIIYTCIGSSDGMQFALVEWLLLSQSDLLLNTYGSRFPRFTRTFIHTSIHTRIIDMHTYSIYKYTLNHYFINIHAYIILLRIIISYTHMHAHAYILCLALPSRLPKCTAGR